MRKLHLSVALASLLAFVGSAYADVITIGKTPVEILAPNETAFVRAYRNDIRFTMSAASPDVSKEDYWMELK